MTDVIMFHHAQGLAEGVRESADQLRAARIASPCPISTTAQPSACATVAR